MQGAEFLKARPLRPLDKLTRSPRLPFQIPASIEVIAHKLPIRG